MSNSARSMRMSSSMAQQQQQSRKSNRRRPDPPAANQSTAIVSPTFDGGSSAASDLEDEVDLRNEPWRQYGYQRRQYLLENDKAATSYRMNAACSIQKYFALSERVIAQFHDLCEKNAIEDAYVMGNRLIAFLGTALPRHPAYATSVAQRTVTQHHLQQIQLDMQRISILIDEEQLNRYITNDFDPLIDDDEEDGDDLLLSPGDNFEPFASWETFAGWSGQNDNLTPGFVDTDESSQDIDSDIDFADFDITKRWGTSSIRSDKSILNQIESPVAYIYDDDSDDSDDGRADPIAMRMKPPVLTQSILRKVAREAVRYESDSEAADSWAQDGNCGASDATSSSEVGDAATTTSSTLYHNHSPQAAAVAPIISSDPARMAFRSIMNRHTRHLQSLQVEMESLLSPDPMPYDPQPRTIPETKFDLPHIPHESSTIEEEKKEDELTHDDQDEKSDQALKPAQVYDALTVSFSFPLPSPAISAPREIDTELKELMNASKNTVSDVSTGHLRPAREESPFRPISQSMPDTPHNSPEEANLHRSTVVSNRWGVQLRRTPLAQSPSPCLLRHQVL